MHELGIMNDVLETALRVAEKNGGKRVVKIVLKIGAMSGVVPKYVQSFFKMIAKDTIAADAEIEIIIDPAIYLCYECGTKTRYTKPDRKYVCDNCNGELLRLLSGYGFQISSVAIS